MAAALQLLSNLSSPITVLKDGDALQTRPRINIVEGSNVTIDIADDAVNYKTDIIITATGGGGSGSGTVTSVELSGGTTGLSFSGGPITSSGTITIGGTLGVANGGTGKTTFTPGYVKADGTSVFSTVGAIPGSDVSGNISGNASSITSVLPISLGGTNATTASDARSSLGLGAVAVENVVSIAKGGTGSTTASDARNALDVPTKAGSGATGTWGIDISGNAATVSNGVYTTGSYANPAWIASLAGGKVTGNISGNAANVTGVVQIANGGTGATTASAALNALGGYPNTNPAGYTTNTGTVTSVSGNGTVNGITLTGTVTTSGNITLGGTLSNVSLTSQVTGTLPIGNGGTGAITAANALTNLGAYPASNPSGFTSNTGTVTSVDLSGGTTGMTFSGGPITSSGTITIDGTLEVANGGTGKNTFTSGYLKANGTTAFTTVASIPGTDITGNISGNASSLTSVLPISLGGTNATTASDARTSLGLGSVATENIVPIAKGGTGATTATAARTALDVPSTSGGGATGTWGINISGSAATVTNGVYTTGSYADPSWITSLAGSKVTGNISGNAGNVTGVVQIANGGTGATTASAALNALGGYPNTNPAGYTTNTGTVTSVGLTAGTGISISGGPITTSGSITVTNSAPLPTGGSKYSILKKNSTTNYDASFYGPYEVNVLDYGADNTGATSASTAISNAIAAVQVGASGTGSSVTEVVIVDGGSGYTGTPTVSISGGSGFSGTAIVRDQMVIAVTITSAGSGYSGTAVVSFSGGGGSGASAYAIIGKGGKLVFPPGIYYVPDGIGFGSLHNVYVEMSGATFKRDVTSTQPGLYIQGSCKNSVFHGAYLEGNASDRNGSYGVGILVQGDAITLDSCAVSKWPNFAIQIYADTYNDNRYFSGPTIVNCRINNTYADGIHVGHGFIQPKIINNVITETEEEDGIGIFNDFLSNLATRDILVANNLIRNSRWRGILVAGIVGGNISGNIVDGTANYGIGGDDGKSSGSITLSLTTSSPTATVTSGTPFVGAYISGTGLSLPAVITAVSGSTVTLSQTANATGSYTFSMYQGSFNVTVSSNTVFRVGAVTKNGGTGSQLHGIYMLRGAKAQVSNNLCVGMPAGGYAVKVEEFVDIYVTANGGYDMVSGYLTFSVGSNVYGTRALYDDSGALKYRGTSGTVTTLAPA